MLKKFGIVFLFVISILSISLFVYAQKKTQQRATVQEKIVVKGPKVTIQKDFTLFEKLGDKRPVATKGSNYIEANVIKFFSAKNFTISEGDVVFRNYEKNIDITSGYCEFYGNTGDVLFSQSPRMYLSNNNMYAGGDAVFMNINEDKVIVQTNAFITNENLRAFSMFLEYISKQNLAKMIGDVKIFSTNMSIRSDLAFVSIYSNVVSNYIGYGNVFVEAKNISAKSQYLFAVFKNTNEIDKYTLLTNVVVDSKDIYVEAFKMVGVVSNVVEGGKTNEYKFYTFTGGGSPVFYQNRKEDTTLECDLLEVLMDSENELISSVAKGRVRVVK